MRFDNNIDTTAAPPLPILIARHDKTIRAILINHSYRGVRTHWWGGHTVACCGTANCQACSGNQQWVKKFYIVGQHPCTGSRGLLMLTPLAAEQLVMRRRDDLGYLGVEIILGRAAKRNTSAMTVSFVGYHTEFSDFGMERLEQVLMRIFSENAQTGHG